MSIDAKEWTEKYLKQNCDNILRDSETRYGAAVQFHIDLIRAVIAAELPNITKAVLNHPLDKLGDPIECDTFAEALPPQPVAAGDVPEWPDTLTVQGVVWIPRERAESELSRRVAEVTADRDRWIERVGEHAAAMKVIAIERDALRQQLAASQAEVERLTKLNETPRSFDEAVHGVQSMIDAMGSMGRNREEITKLREENARLKEANAEHLKQRLILDAEVSRLSRPVDGVWDKMVDLAREIPAVAVGDIAIGCTASLMYRTVEPLLQSERNARESAERERDELREACNKYVAISNTSDENKKHTMYAASERHGAWGNRCVDYIYATPADAVLAAYRAERAKVQA